MDEQQKLLRKLNRRTRFTQFLAWLAIFFTAVGIAAGYKNWLRIHDKAKAGLRGIEEIRQELPQFADKKRLALLEKEINDNFKDNKQHLDSAMKELRNIQDSTQHIAETVYTQVEALTKQQEAAVNNQTPAINDWSLGEVHFLLQTAVQRFNLKQDQKGAIAAFKLADSLLIERGSIKLLPVRKQISADIAAASQYAPADTGVLSQKIDSLLTQLKPKPSKTEKKGEDIALISNDSKDAPTTSNTKGKAPQDSLVARVKKTINQAVVIRKYDKAIQTEMDSENKDRLYQLLSLRLETLRMMLLQGDDENYHLQVQRIKKLIESYYPKDNNNKLISLLDLLNKANLKPETPDVSRSLALLEALMSKPNSTPQNKD